MLDWKRCRSYLAAAAVAASLAACGGTSGPTPVTTPTPTLSPTPRPPVVLDKGEGQLPVRAALFRPLATTETGAFDVKVDWTFAANDIDVFLARGTCTFEQFVAEQCTVAAMTTSTTAKPETVRLANQPAGTYTLVVANFGPGDESIAYQVVFTPGTAAASASQPTAEGRTDKITQLRRGIVVKQ
jgi:hypothetical protein